MLPKKRKSLLNRQFCSTSNYNNVLQEPEVKNQLRQKQQIHKNKEPQFFVKKRNGEQMNLFSDKNRRVPQQQYRMTKIVINQTFPIIQILFIKLIFHRMSEGCYKINTPSCYKLIPVLISILLFVILTQIYSFIMQHQLDFTKLYCQTHPYELVTNYCNDQKCLVGLCATCICSHTEMHAQFATIPQFQNIRDTFSSLHDEARNQISHLEDDKNLLGSLRQSIEVNKINIKKMIRQLRQETVNKIKDEFDSLEKKILNDINSEQKKQGFHSNIRFQTLSKNLCRQTETLLGYIQGLNSPNFLEWTKKLKRQALTETNDSRLKIQKQISDNDKYTANLKWNQNFMEDLVNIIKKAFSLQFLIPKRTEQIRNCVAVLKPSSTSVLNRSNSQPKLSHGPTKNNSLLGLSKFADSTSYSTFFNEPMQKSSITMQKRSLLRNNTSMTSSQLSDYDVLGSKQNRLTRSSYITELGICNNSSFMKAGFQNQRLNNQIQMNRKELNRNPNSQSMRVSMISRDGESGLRMY